ncbi:CENP-B homolog protein 2-like [Apium graveolens]|uniref:CENP-B homolog protein 2-like n=1 Tax=Apium graveolens TaxID=4045 RepID=UPI003D7A715B
MVSHLKGVTKSTMTDEARKALCEYKRENSSCTQKDLQLWLENKFHLKVSQGIISNTLKRSADYLAANYLEKRKDIKRYKPAKYPDMEKVLYEWFLQYQDRVNMTGELILEKAKETMKILYPQQDQEHTFSQGWLEKFKLKHGIKSFRRFGESGSVDVQDMEKKLESIREKINQFPMKDVFNMDETGLFYRLQADHSLATKQLEGRKQDKERLTVVIWCNEDGSEKIPLWIIGKYAKPRCFKNVNMGSLNCHYHANKRAWMTSVLFDEYIRWFDSQMQGRRILFVVDNCPAHPKNIEGLQNVELYFLEYIHELEVMIKDLGYRNKMDVNNFLDYPGENESCSEVQSIEEIANTILENSVEDDLEDDTTPLEPVTRKEALKASKMLNNFLMQHESTTPELLDAIRKIRDEFHVDLNYMKKQTTIESYFTKM